MRNALTILFLLFLFSACNPASRLPDGQYLLQRNRINVADADIRKDELQTFIRQKPNRRILGFYRFHLNVYLFASRGKETKIRQWMKNTIGEPPVIFDPVLADNTGKQFQLYMQSKGYFNAEVTYHHTLKNNKATVNYHITGNKPYRIRSLTYNIPDSHLAQFVYADTLNTLIKKGNRYDTDVLQQQRLNISRSLKDQGFYQFSRDFIHFRIDSTLSRQELDIEMLINDPQDIHPFRRETESGPRHKRFVIDSIIIFPDHSPFVPASVHSDTTVFVQTKNNTRQTFTFLHNEPLRIRPRAIINNMVLEPGNFYSISDVELTYNYLSRLRNFRFINILFEEKTASGKMGMNDTIDYLNARVELSRSPANAFTIEAEGLNTSGNLGVAGNVIFHNRNIFKGAEVFNLRLKGALEISGETNRQEVIQSLPFNTLELGAEASLDFARLLVPLGKDRLSKTARPKSTLLTGINYRQRPDYTRYIYNLSYGFEWSPDSRKRQFLNPLEISSIKILNDSLLQAKIPGNNPLILSRFQDHLITGSKYSYYYSSQQLGRESDFVYFRGNIEAAGNLLYMMSKGLDFNRDNNNSYTLFNIPFAQYIKGDADFRYYNVFNENSILVYRLMTGIGIPYGNLNVLPFIKSYYGGGANGIRAWDIYSLGPGGYQDSLDVRFDRYGDIKLEANIEYRFSIYKYWKAALFLDAGNVWFFKENPQFPGGEFILNRFYKDIAIGTGAGIRLDFDFFIVRVDAAFPIRNPALASGNRWVGKVPGITKWNFNLGIGYPF